MPHARARSFVAATVLAGVCAVSATSAAAAQSAVCGDLDGSGTIAASDSLLLLKRAVGQSVTISCPLCANLGAGVHASRTLAQSEVCGDLDGSGTIAASDSLLLLKRAVGQSVEVSCPVCASTTTVSGSTTTTVDGQTTTTIESVAVCGNGVKDGTDECEGLDGCEAGQRCTATCTCETIAVPPPTSQQLIAEALARGDIDYPTSILYRVWALFLAPELPEAYDGAGTAGEDTDLVIDLSYVRGTLPAEIEAAITPYLVRPTDPASIYSAEPPATALTASNAAEAETPEAVNCPRVNGVANWGAFGTAHFVVWSCESGRCETGKPVGTACEDHTDCDSAEGELDGTCTAATDVARRLVVGTVAEEIYAAFTPELGPPRADDYEAGPEPRGRIDIYMIRPNECRLRNGSCAGLDGSIAAAMADTPCDRQGGGPLTSSGYALVNADDVPVLAPGAEASKFRADLDHELFHVWEYGLNVEVMGKVCSPDPVNSSAKGKTWLTEASAEWASFGYFPQDDEERRTALFGAFQTERDPANEGLHSTNGDRPYEAALYLQFLQQDAGGRQPIVDLWTTSQAARTKEDFDKHLDSIVSFADFFREFGVRDLNKQLPGAPITPLFSDLDEGRPEGVLPGILLPVMNLLPLMKFDRSIEIAPLFAQFEQYTVHADARLVRIDVSDVANSEHLQLDAIVKVGSSWQRRSIEGPIFEFCREDEADDISEFYLVLSNDDRMREGKIDGKYKVEAKPVCPGGWSGQIRTVLTLDESSDETLPVGRAVLERHEREEQSWTVSETNLVDSPFSPDPIEQLTMAWQVTSSENTTSSLAEECGVSTSTQVSNAGFAAKTLFNALPLAAGAFMVQPAELGHSFDMDVTYTNDKQCDGTFQTDHGTELVVEGLAYLISSPEFSPLLPQVGNPGRFVGNAVILHDEQPRPGGSLVIDLTLSWDLVRTLAR